jgi:hypothetical protein
MSKSDGTPAWIIVNEDIADAHIGDIGEPALIPVSRGVSWAGEHRQIHKREYGIAAFVIGCTRVPAFIEGYLVKIRQQVHNPAVARSRCVTVLSKIGASGGQPSLMSVGP